MSTSLYENMMNKYGHHQEIIDQLNNIKSYELDSVLSFIIEKIQINKVNCHFIYNAINQLCEVNISCIREYWHIYDQIYQFSKVMPKIFNSFNAIQLLFAKKYNINTRCWIDNYKGKNSDEILNYYESDPVMRCIIHDDIKSLINIINSSLDFDFNQEIFYKSLIENCCFCGSVECFKFLRSNGIKITKNCLDFSIVGRNRSIINECIQHFTPNYSTMLKVVQVHDFDMAVSFEHMYGLSISLFRVTRCCDIRLFFYLMSKSSNFDEFLRYCVYFKIPELIDDIISLGAKINATDSDGRSALFEAARDNNIDAITKLIEHGASIEELDNAKRTPLFDAAQSNSIEAITKLIELGANIEKRSIRDDTPLFEATYDYTIEAMTKLIELGANIEVKDNNGRTPLFDAVINENVEGIAKLIEYKANIEAKDNNGKTPLFEASIMNNVGVMSILIDHGANIEAKDNEGKTPLFEAVYFNAFNTITKLIEHGANVEATDKYGKTPLFYGSIPGTLVEDNKTLYKLVLQSSTRN